LVVVVLGGAALTRGVADLVAALRLREASVAARAGRLLELTPDRAVGVAGYSAGLTDFESGSQRGSGPRHRAAPRASAVALSDLSAPAPPPVRAQAQLPQGGPAGTFHDEVLRTTADLDAMLALAGVTGAAVPGAAAQAAAQEHVEVPDTAEGAEPAAEESRAATQRQAQVSDGAARAGEAAPPGMDDTSIIARSRPVD
jgi:hypothetical protein